jgi:DNA uptake protein ComE-like DNA-binding protein
MSENGAVAEVIDFNPAARRTKKVKKKKERSKSGITEKGLTLVGEFAPLIRTSELADWLNYANGGRSEWTSDRVRDYLMKVGALSKLAEDEEYAGSPRRPKPKTSRRTYFTTLNLLAEKLPEFYQCLVSAVDADVQERLAGISRADG